MRNYLRILLIACLAFFGQTLKAQTWSGSEVSEGYYHLYNVGSGQFFTFGNGWGTEASIGTIGQAINAELIASDGYYAVRTRVNNESWGLEVMSGGTCYTDQSRGKLSLWEFIPVNTENGIAYNLISRSNHSGGSGAYLTANSANTIVGSGNNGNDPYAQWILLNSDGYNSMIQSLLSGATLTNAVDATFLIKDPNFELDPITATPLCWTITANNYNIRGGLSSNYCAESWRAPFTLSQTIKVPNGRYKLRAQAALTEYTVTGKNFPVVYLNDATVPFKVMQYGENNMGTISSQFSNGNYFTDYTEIVNVTNNTITLGARGTRSDTWAIWDNFQLLYMGLPEDLSSYEALLAEVVNNANALQNALPAAAYDAIMAVVNEQNKTYSTIAEYNSAIQAINAAIEQYGSAEIQEAYSRFLSKHSKIEELSQQPVYTSDTELDLSAADATVAKAVTLEGIEEAITLLYASLNTFLASVQLDDECYFDLTDIFIVNPAPYSSSEGWTVLNADGMPAKINLFSPGNRNAEFWNQRGYSISQILEGLPNGFYELNCIAFTRAACPNGTPQRPYDMDAILRAGEEQMYIARFEQTEVNGLPVGATIMDNGRANNLLYFNVREDQDITISLMADADEGHSDWWLVWRSFSLHYWGANKIQFLKSQLATLVTEAENVRETLVDGIPAAVLDIFDDAISDAYELYDTEEEYEQAIAALQSAIQQARDSYNTFSPIMLRYNKKRNDTDILVASVEKTADANSLSHLTAQIQQADQMCAKAGAVQDVEAAIAVLEQAALQFINAIDPDEVSTADITVLLNNPDFEFSNEYEIDTEGWTTEYSSDGQHDYTNVRTGGTTTNICYESYQALTFDVYQEVENLPAGVYEIEVQGFYRYKYGRDEGWADYQAQEMEYVKPEGVPVYVYLNNNETPFANIYSEPVEAGELYQSSNYGKAYTDPNGEYWYPNEMYNSAIAFENGMYKRSAYGLIADDGGVMRIGVKGSTNQSNGSWCIWDNFILRYRGFKADVVQPVLETAMQDCEIYKNLLMGKSEYAALMQAFADAEAAIQTQDGPAMFAALNDFYNIKEQVIASKDLFIEEDVALSLADLQSAIDEAEGQPLNAAVFQNAINLRDGILGNSIYEGSEIDKLKNDVESAINEMEISIIDYADVFPDYISQIRSEIQALGDYYAQSPLVADLTALADELQGLLDAREATTDNMSDGYERKYQYEDYWTKHLEESEIAILRNVQESLRTNNEWTGNWDLDAEELELNGVSIYAGWVDGIDLSHQGLKGTIMASNFTLPHQGWLTLTGNSLSDVDGTFLISDMNVDIAAQVLTEEVTLNLPTVSNESLLAQLPPITRYSYGIQGLTDEFDFFTGTNDDNLRFRNTNGYLEIVCSPNYVYRGKSGDILTFTSTYGETWGTTFPVRITFEQGDASFDGEIGIEDVQLTVNYIFNERTDNGCFNFTAANLWEDDRINVQDVVKMVDVVLDQPLPANDEPNSNGAKAYAPRRILTPTSDAYASIGFINGQLVIDTEEPIAAFDICLHTKAKVNLSALQTLGFSVATRSTAEGMRIVAYSLSGAEIPLGATAIATTSENNASVVAAKLTDRSARAIRVALNSDIATGVSAIDDGSSTNTIFDISGRKLPNSKQSKGVYIVNGRKIVNK